MKSYCNELETIATSLTNLSTSIIDNRLALQVLHGLNSDYKTFRSLVQHMNPIPSFDTLRSMLKLEERSNHKPTSLAQGSALVTTSKASSSENSTHYDSRGPPTTVVATVTLVVVAGPAVVATLAPPAILANGSALIPSPTLLWFSAQQTLPGPTSFVPYRSWPYWAGHHWAQPTAPFPTTS